jgi:hypothetical protein
MLEVKMFSLWLLALPAMALRPDPSIYIGTEPSRVLRFHKEQQSRLRNGPRWQGFLESEGDTWRARFDERTGGVVRAWGPGIPFEALTDLDAVEAAVRGFFSAHVELLGIPMEALRLGRSGYVRQTDTWLVQFDEVIPGTNIKVWRAGLKVRIKQGRMVMFGIDTHPSAMKMPVAPAFDAKQATNIAISSGPAGNGAHTDISAVLTVLPEDNGHSLTPMLVWEIRSKTETPKGHWVSFVDALSGGLINVHNEVRFGSGVVSTEHDVRTVNGEMTASPLSGFRVGTEETIAYADDDGVWSLDIDDPIEGDLFGEFVRVRNQGGDNAKFPDIEGEVTLTDADASQAELDAYVFQHQIRDWAYQHAPDLSFLDLRLDVYVNINENCNAYFDGALNFMKKGGGCNNTARIADVNFHEWGHGFHYYNLQTGEFDGAMSEGIGDTVAFLNTGDSIISPYFGVNGEGIRDVEPNRVYPDDWRNEVHEDGLIFAGAVWDLWHLLEDKLGPEEAYDTVNRLLVESTKAGPTIPEVFDEFIFADDDNGNLADGTPNTCTIIEAFALHGLGPGGDGGLFHLMHEQLAQQSEESETLVSVEVINMAPQCTDASLGTATVYYSTNGGADWSSVSMSADSETLSGAIPGQPAGTVVSYYFEVDTGEDSVSRSPRGGEINPFTYYVGAVTQLYCENFDLDDGGFTHTLVSGGWEEGADDWQWGTPIGMGGDPDFAFSGNKVWGNDLGGDPYNGEYQNDKHNRLDSAPIDVGSHTSLVLQYRRWLTVEDGMYDQANIVVNGEPVWTNYGNGMQETTGDEHHKDDQWIQHVVPIQLDAAGNLTIGWEIISDRGLTMGGWTIDDVCVYARGKAMDDTEGESDDGGPTGVSGYQRGDTLIFEGEKQGCACTSGRGSAPIGWLGLFLTALTAAIRRRER